MARGSETEWASSSYLLKNIALASEYVDEETQNIDWEAITHPTRMSMFSDGERVLVGTALAMFTGRHNDGASVADWLNWLDDESLEKVLDAVKIRKGWGLDPVEP